MSESSRITLGQFLKDANHTAKENLSGQEESRLVAPFAYNPGFPSEPADGTVSTDTEQRIDTEQTPILDSENDLSLASKKALNEYTQDRLQSGKNRFRPKKTHKPHAQGMPEATHLTEITQVSKALQLVKMKSLHIQTIL